MSNEIPLADLVQAAQQLDAWFRMRGIINIVELPEISRITASLVHEIVAEHNELIQLRADLTRVNCEWEISKTAWQIEHKIKEIKESDLARVSAEAAAMREKLEIAKHSALNIYHGTAQEYRERAVTLAGNLNEFLASTNAGRDFVRRDDSHAILALNLIDLETGKKKPLFEYVAENKRYVKLLGECVRELESKIHFTQWPDCKVLEDARAELQRTEKE